MDKLAISLPLFVDLQRKTKKAKRIYLNLNVFRNNHYQINNEIKRQYRDIVHLAILGAGYRLDKPLTPPLRATYTLYPQSKRRIDISNPLSIVDKFFCDAITSLNLIPDDDYKNIPEVRYLFGAVDKNRPRCDVVLETIARIK